VLGGERKGVTSGEEWKQKGLKEKKRQKVPVPLRYQKNKGWGGRSQRMKAARRPILVRIKGYSRVQRRKRQTARMRGKHPGGGGGSKSGSAERIGDRLLIGLGGQENTKCGGEPGKGGQGARNLVTMASRRSRSVHERKKRSGKYWVKSRLRKNGGHVQKNNGERQRPDRRRTSTK